ncbi:MobH family relaxase [Vibrio aestuarianus]|uniref:MobH family relaxase n=1 Tax=Vibrio aestuarianus TaxID=28171 RepID=UPI00237D0057|nr:MobH family relaxase [Vibrio aestuarianus]MDE1237843.1 TraI domain-containing protein [Vibrio aestuarianus]
MFNKILYFVLFWKRNVDEKSIELTKEETHYPPTVSGIKVKSSREVISMFETTINEIREGLGISYEHFDRYIRPVINNVITQVHDLPASQGHHHHSPGGLVFHLLDVAKRTINLAKCSYFQSSTGEFQSGQRCAELRRVACLLAALNHDIGKVFTDIVISNGQKGDNNIKWHPAGGMSLYEWTTKHNITEYFVSWRKGRHNEHKQASVALSMKMIPEDTWNWISSSIEGQDICIELWNAISGFGDDNQIKTIVTQADIDSVKFDLSYQYKHWSLEPVRRPIHELVKIFVKYLISRNEWQINRKDSVLWYIDNELYITWDRAVSQLKEHLDNLEFSIPTKPDVLAKTLMEEGFAEESDEGFYFWIYPEILGTAKKPVRLKCLKLTDASSVLTEIEKVYPIKQYQVTPSAVVSELDGPSLPFPVGDDSASEIPALTLSNEVSKPVNTDNSKPTEKGPTIKDFLVDNGFKTSGDGVIAIAQSDIETAVQLLLTSEIAGINEINAYSKLKSCEQVVFV